MIYLPFYYKYFLSQEIIVKYIGGALLIFSFLLVFASSFLMAHKIPFKNISTSMDLKNLELVFLLGWYAISASTPYAWLVVLRHFFVRPAGYYIIIWLIGLIICLLWSLFKQWYPFENIKLKS